MLENDIYTCIILYIYIYIVLHMDKSWLIPD